MSMYLVVPLTNGQDSPLFRVGQPPGDLINPFRTLNETAQKMEAVSNHTLIDPSVANPNLTLRPFLTNSNRDTSLISIRTLLGTVPQGRPVQRCYRSQIEPSPFDWQLRPLENLLHRREENPFIGVALPEVSREPTNEGGPPPYLNPGESASLSSSGSNEREERIRELLGPHRTSQILSLAAHNERLRRRVVSSFAPEEQQRDAPSPLSRPEPSRFLSAPLEFSQHPFFQTMRPSVSETSTPPLSFDSVEQESLFSRPSLRWCRAIVNANTKGVGVDPENLKAANQILDDFRGYKEARNRKRIRHDHDLNRAHKIARGVVDGATPNERRSAQRIVHNMIVADEQERTQAVMNQAVKLLMERQAPLRTIKHVQQILSPAPPQGPVAKRK